MVDADTHSKCDLHSDSLLTDNSSPRRHSSVDEIFGLVSSISLNGQRQRSLSDSGGSKETNLNGEFLLDYCDCKYFFI